MNIIDMSLHDVIKKNSKLLYELYQYDNGHKVIMPVSYITWYDDFLKSSPKGRLINVFPEEKRTISKKLFDLNDYNSKVYPDFTYEYLSKQNLQGDFAEKNNSLGYVNPVIDFSEESTKNMLNEKLFNESQLYSTIFDRVQQENTYHDAIVMPMNTLCNTGITALYNNNVLRRYLSVLLQDKTHCTYVSNSFIKTYLPSNWNKHDNSNWHKIVMNTLQDTDISVGNRYISSFISKNNIQLEFVTMLVSKKNDGKESIFTVDNPVSKQREFFRITGSVVAQGVYTKSTITDMKTNEVLYTRSPEIHTDYVSWKDYLEDLHIFAGMI